TVRVLPETLSTVSTKGFHHSVCYSILDQSNAKKVRVSKSIAVLITSLQTLQMAVGMVVGFYALSMKLSGVDCDVPVPNLLWSLAMYSSYFALFVNFFRKSYFRREERRGLKHQ
ncbi:unnamed protein product, partial [Allacma fusca]